MNTHNDKFKITYCHASMHVAGTPPNQWREGSVQTPLGIVVVYSQAAGKNATHTSFDFIHKGTLYRQRIDRRYSDRGLATVAHRFAQLIVRSH